MLRRRHLLIALPVLGLAACEAPRGESSVREGSAPSRGTEIGRLTFNAVDRMLAAAPGILADTPFIVATVADVADLNTAAPFGNLIAELMRARLTQRGMNVTDQRVRSGLRMDRREGELILSREPSALLRAPQAGAIATGTYAAAGDYVYVSLQVVSATDGRILAASSYAVPRWPDAAGLLRRPDPARRT
jgi:TolB-like protein